MNSWGTLVTSLLIAFGTIAAAAAAYSAYRVARESNQVQKDMADREEKLLTKLNDKQMNLQESHFIEQQSRDELIRTTDEEKVIETLKREQVDKVAAWIEKKENSKGSWPKCICISNASTLPIYNVQLMLPLNKEYKYEFPNQGFLKENDIPPNTGSTHWIRNPDEAAAKAWDEKEIVIAIIFEDASGLRWVKDGTKPGVELTDMEPSEFFRAKIKTLNEQNESKKDPGSGFEPLIYE